MFKMFIVLIDHEIVITVKKNYYFGRKDKFYLTKLTFETHIINQFFKTCYSKITQ